MTGRRRPAPPPRADRGSVDPRWRRAPAYPPAGAVRRRRSRGGIAVLLLALLLLVLVGGLAVAVSGVATPERSTEGLTGEVADGELSYPRHSYEWANLQRNGDRLAYVHEGRVLSRVGVDVSEHQGAIDWQAVAGDGIGFAYIRLGYRGTSTGALARDARFSDNLAGARAAGLDCGVYVFSQAISEEEAREEARMALDALGGAALQLPVAFDFEIAAAGTGASRAKGLSRDQMSSIARAFAREMKAGGYDTVIYGNAADLGRYRMSDLVDYPLWWAEYGTPVPTTRSRFSLWQYTNEGSVAGIRGSVDLNIDLTQAQ
ncbi:hypothetical protein HLV37_02505 [Eggerthellaceae bacterium zg-1084]|nr:hypothetical protein [Berryella wangjianweii]